MYSITLVLVFVTFVFFNIYIHVVLIGKLSHLVDALFCGCLLHYGCDGCLCICTSSFDRSREVKRQRGMGGSV